ncbi:MAG: OB-fold domain-containing protein [Candidatus Binatia bacterium]
MRQGNIGIVSYGSYVPFNRLRRAAIGEALGKRAGVGERAVASYDEDSVSMAVEAMRCCLARVTEPGQVESLFLASSSPPYVEKLNSSAVHAACGLASPVRCLDVGNSARAGLSALITAARCAGDGRLSAVVMSDVCAGAPEGPAELELGDAAAAFVLGSDGVLARIAASYSESREYLASWRLPEEKFGHSWEERFSLTQAFVPLLGRALNAICEAAGVGPGELDAVIVDAPNRRAAVAVAKAAGLRSEQLVDDLRDSVGYSRAAHAGLMLAAALDSAYPGQRIAILSVSDGVDALMLETTEALGAFEAKRSVSSLVASKRNDLAYTSYLKWRGILDTEPPRRPDPDRPAAPPSFRAERWKFGFVGSRCNSCGTNHLPPQVVCVECGATGEMSEVPLAESRAHIRTFTVDRLAFSPQPPVVVAMVDFDGGGRFQSELTDCEPDRVAIGDEVEMTFRRLFTAGGVHNYFWKARPLR